MHGITDPANIAQWLGEWGYLGIFVCVFIGNLGIPVPEETVMLAAGFLSGRELLDLKIVYLVVTLSAITGDCCGFLIGRTGGQRVLIRLADRSEFLRTRYERLQTFFQTHGNKAVFMARFVTGARFMAGPMAGACGMPFFRFLGWNILGAIVWCTIVVTVGYLLGDELYRVVQMTHQASRWIAVAIVLVSVGIFVYWWRERHQAVTRPEP
ncbi:MAG: DedA family protein [Candidatus Binatus sp.]|uniref:DedA family protein n=1 Tax=Candidatus Binatus sp. TaxID=2811406 RepID=UPI002719F57A|nr:DedA family protein [Candidatus Binatus sp.]MDO8434311.1 DedA family protein [Candidatus Binatus sp.]